MRQFIQILLLSSLAAPAVVAQTVKPWSPPYEMEVIDLPVSANGIGYRLFVRKPLFAPPEGEPPAVIYLLDAMWDTPAVAAAQSNAESLNHFPALYYVGIGYQNETGRYRDERNRTRDYTPTSWAPVDPSQHFLKPEDYENSGQAAAFLDVVEREIMPFVESHYQIKPVIRGLVGKSTAGLLATTAVLTRPALFTHYLIISPALWWDDYFVDFRDRAVMRLERESHENELTQPAKVWIGMGDGEERLGMLADVFVLGRALRLRNDSNLDLTIEVIPDEVHESIYMPAFSRGIRHLLWR